MLISRVSAALAPMLVLTLVAAGLVFLPPAPQTAAAADASLTLSASSSAVHPGDSFSVSVDLTMPAGAHALSTVAFRVTFDASLMTVQDAAPSGSFPSVMEKATTASFVGLSLSVGSDNNSAVATSTNVATIQFQAKAVADTKASLHIRDASAFSIAAADSPAANIIGGSSGTSVCIAADLDCSPPQLALSKEKSKYNGRVLATMTDFTASNALTVRWPDGTVLCSTTANSDGDGSCWFRTPLRPLGNYAVSATDTNGKEAHRTVIQPVNAHLQSNAEYLLASLLLLFRRGIGAALRGERHAPGAVGRELHGSTIGILGLAPSGHVLAMLLDALGAKLIGYDPAVHQAASTWQRLKIQPVNLPELLARADAVSVQVMYASRYEHFINDNVLAHCRRGQLWVGTTRTSLFDPQALARALTDGRIEAAMLDGAESGFASGDSPLKGLPNLFLTPRVGSLTREARVRASWYVAQRLHESLTQPRHSGFDSILSAPMGLDSLLPESGPVPLSGPAPLADDPD
jgi:D-3-phosphoglycerate dehydrogenase